MFVAFIFFISLIACNKEEVFLEKEAEIEIVDDNEEEQEGENEDVIDTSEDSERDSALPCEFELGEVLPNQTVAINCALDLGGATVVLPSGVTIAYEGGEITNGTIYFSGDSIIDSELLNQTLNLDGTLPRLSDPLFTFNPEKWGIVEGKVADEIALNNKQILVNVISLIKKLKGNIFLINEIDAYFDVSSRVNNPKIKSENSIVIPSNFELRMTDNAFLRVQPTNAHAYSLIMVYKGENIKITGGNLIGDRWEHDYTPVVDLYGKTYYSHDWGHVTHVSGGKNILLEGIKISNGAGDGFVVHGSTIRAEDGSPGDAVISENVTVRNCIVDASRRNGLSILDGDGILVENCQIINTAQGENPPGVDYSSAGTWPRQGISFEAWRVREDDGTLKEYEKIENVTLRGNTFKGNAVGDIVFFTCSFVTVEENFFDSMVTNIASHDIVVRNNTFEARIENGEPFEHAMIFKSRLDPFGEEFNRNYQIYGNKINGYKNGITLAGNNYEVHDNDLTDFKTGIVLGNKLHGAEIYNNKLRTSLPTSFGYVSRGADIVNVNIRKEEVDVTRRPIDLYDLIADSANNIIFDDCSFRSSDNKANNIDGCENITIQNSTINTDVNVVNSKNIQLKNNK